MINDLKILGGRVEATPARIAAFGVAVGGLAAMMALKVLGPTALSDLMPTWAFMILAQAAGAALAVAGARR